MEKDKATGEKCTMIITEPNEFIAEVHDRMARRSQFTFLA
jgi:putative SOS response-associated peptidase YedK